MQAIKTVDWVLDREAQRSALRQQELRLLSQLDSIRLEQKSLTKELSERSALRQQELRLLSQLDSIRLEQKSLTKELSEMMSKHLGLKQRKFMAMPA